MNHSDEVFSHHRRAWELIPWVVNGRASGEERRLVEQHLAECSDCREEFAFQSRLRSTMSAERQPEADPEIPLQRLLRRIGGAAAAAELPRRRAAALPLVRGLLLAVVVEAVGLAVLSAVLWTHQPAAATAYRTLSAAPAGTPRATIRAVLAPSLTLSEVQALLERAQLQIVGGPGDSGIYSLAPLSLTTAEATRNALAQLRANPGVRLAEPVDAAPAPP